MAYEKYKVFVSGRILQTVTGEVSSKDVFAKLTSDFIRQVNMISEGKVFFDKNYADNYVYTNYTSNFSSAERLLQNLLDNYVIEQVKKGNFDNIVIDVNTLDLTKFKEKIEELKEEEKKHEELRKKEKEAEKKVNEILESWKKHGVLHEKFGSRIGLHVGGIERYNEVMNIYYKNMQELLEKLLLMNVIDVLTE